MVETLGRRTSGHISFMFGASEKFEPHSKLPEPLRYRDGEARLFLCFRQMNRWLEDWIWAHVSVTCTRLARLIDNNANGFQVISNS